MNLNLKIKIAKRVFAECVDDEMVILDTITQNYFGLDSMGSVMWQTIEQKRVLKDILAKLLDEYEVEPDRLQTDLFIFIERLVESQLLEIEK
ncbi:MAG: PqqD family protein [Sulfurovum sp.]